MATPSTSRLCPRCCPSSQHHQLANSKRLRAQRPRQRRRRWQKKGRLQSSFKHVGAQWITTLAASSIWGILKHRMTTMTPATTSIFRHPMSLMWTRLLMAMTAP